MKRIIYLAILFVATQLHAQTNTNITGKIIDAASKEALQGVTITDKQHTTTTNATGSFSLASNSNTITVNIAGYEPQTITVKQRSNVIIALQQAVNVLDQVVVSANRTAQKRSEAPVAITVINKQTIDEAKAQRIDNVLNKVSGVFMVSLGNEQHQMSIRQPMTTKSLFLYMEDGIPVRTTGVYNHNALIELNLPAAKSIEVIKGPSSALYGAEAIGGAVNIITQSAPAYTAGNVSVQMNNTGYKRADAQVGTSVGKWGIIASGYYADKRNGVIDYSDFHKTGISLRTDYKASDKTTWSNTLSYVDYYSQMTGSLDSTKFATKNYLSQHTFTFRSVYALRIKSMLTHQWNKQSESSVSFMYRDNSVKQNPSYSVGSTSNPAVFRGQINDNAFKTYALFAQHVQRFAFLQSKLVVGASLDVSPQSYYAKFISIQKDVVSGKFVSYTMPTKDSMLSDYKTDITNIASFVNYEANISKHVKLVAALRYDAFTYKFNTNITKGSPDTTNKYSRVTPKIGFTYNNKGIGFYANYSEGYVPPQLTELYSNSVAKVPYLLPQSFKNYEVGGWLSLVKNRLYADWSIYLLNGTDEIISVRQPDNTSMNQNTGKTRHYGIEYGINYKPNAQWAFRFSGTNAKHEFVENIAGGVNYNGKEMSGAPRFVSNAEISYKPVFAKGLRVSAELQHQSRYFMDDLNRYQYKGFDVVNLRAGYQIKFIEVWVNALNALNQFYAINATKSSTASGGTSYSYTLGDPREITIGVALKFGK
jgi:iron complex outermembrane receptor protein